MKVGDLVMLSSYGLNMAPMWNWRREAKKGKCPVGIVVKVRDNPRIYEWTSENDKTFFYVRWCGEGPVSRNNGASQKTSGTVPEDYYYFLRKDLRHAK